MEINQLFLKGFVFCNFSWFIQLISQTRLFIIALRCLLVWPGKCCMFSSTDCTERDIKPSDDEAPGLVLWDMWSTSLLTSFPGPIRLWVIGSYLGVK